LLRSLRAFVLRAGPVLALLCAIVIMPSVGNAHADLESASPPVDGTVTGLPPMMTLVFGEEVKPGTAVVEVTGPDGTRVDRADAAVDLTDPERRTVTVSLMNGDPGEYTVHWENVSNTDGDQVSGDYRFTVAPASVISSPAVAATPQNPTPAVTATVITGDNNNPLDTEGDYDSRGLAISIGAGLLALAAIVGFWIVVRPKNPRFGSRANRDQG
jgi:copper resistance protein C